jgi:hypothetical protein
LFSACTTVALARNSFREEPAVEPVKPVAMNAFHSASDRSPPASVWLVVMCARIPAVVRSGEEPGVVVDFLPNSSADSMSRACSIPFIFSWRVHSSG